MDAAEVVEAHRGQVHGIANKMTRTVVWSHEDMVQEGFIGLLDAHRRHDPEKGTLATIAGWRIRGQISDAKRKGDGVPRSMARKGGGHACQEESLDQPVFDNATRGDLLADPAAVDPVDSVVGEDEAEILRGLVDKLPPREAEVISLYYFGGLQLNDIAGHLGVTESRVCQIHRRALLQLRAALAWGA